MRQTTLASQATFQKYGRKGRREQFLDEMERIVPWSGLLALVRPHYAKAGNGRRPVGLEIMLRTYFLQQWFNLSDPGVEEALYESPVLQRFVGVDLGAAPAPDETTVCRFRHLLEEHDLCGMMLEAVNLHLESKGIKIATGTIVDATFDQERKRQARSGDVPPARATARRSSESCFRLTIPLQRLTDCLKEESMKLKKKVAIVTGASRGADPGRRRRGWLACHPDRPQSWSTRHHHRATQATGHAAPAGRGSRHRLRPGRFKALDAVLGAGNIQNAEAALRAGAGWSSPETIHAMKHSFSVFALGKQITAFSPANNAKAAAATCHKDFLASLLHRHLDYWISPPAIIGSVHRPPLRLAIHPVCISTPRLHLLE